MNPKTATFESPQAFRLLHVLLLTLLPFCLFAQKRILHYTQTTGWDHGTRGVSLQMFQQLGAANNFSVDNDDNGNSFNSLSTLQQYDVIVWSNTSGSHNLNGSQRANFEAYIRAGGNYLGIHAASDTYRHSSSNGGGTGAWDFYAESVCGGSVQQNPNHTAQNFNSTMDHVGSHPALENIPSPWNKPEEYYYWEGGYLSPQISEMLRVRSTGGQSYDSPRPISWSMELPWGGRSFYSALGHDPSNYTSDNNFRNHIRDGLLWVMEESNGGGGDPGNGGGNGDVVISGELKTWHRVSLTFDGPQVSETDGNNPFLNYRLDVTFTKGNKSYRVPGFFAADGNAAESSASNGNKWRVHFIPDEEGTWNYQASFRQGNDVAVSDNVNAGSATSFDGANGSFSVNSTDKTGRDHRAKGMLKVVGKHHFQFAGDGSYYLKGGADSPENFLGYVDFDNTVDHGGIETPGLNNGLHQYQPHVQDWNNGDPSWKGGKGKGIIGAINYLSSVGGNSIYFLTYNTDGGDGRDTYMWIDPGQRTRYDVSKLAQWEIVFSHMDKMGIQLHVVTQEVENDRAMGGLSNERKLYYRELAARFSHHLALQWNIGEENSNDYGDKRAFANYIKSVDPYDHPITVHTFYDQASSYYDGLVGDPGYDATSIQGGVGQYNGWAIELRNKSANAGRKWAIYGDEQGPAVDPNGGNLGSLREGLWGNLMGGGAGTEWYFGYQNTFGDVQSENWRTVDQLWRQTGYAISFFQQNLPFQDMDPRNDLTSNGQLLAKVGEVYALYLENGGSANVNLNGVGGTLPVFWFNPREGGNLLQGSVAEVNGGGSRNIGNAPGGGGDWVVLIGNPGGGTGSDGGGGDCLATYVEQDGKLIIEAETGNTVSGWDLNTTEAGYTGDGYITWTGGDAFNFPGSGKRIVPIEIKNPGTYRFVWRTRITTGNNNTEHNDAWLRFPDAADFFAVRDNDGHTVYPHGSGKSPTPDGSGADGWFKIYMNQLGVWSWTTQTSDNDAHQIYVRFDQPGVYTLEVSGRSNGYSLDRMALVEENMPLSAVTNPSLAETKCDDGGTGGTGNTPPRFTLSGDIQVIENFTTIETVTVSPGTVPQEEADQEVSYTISPATISFANMDFDPATGNVSFTAIPGMIGQQQFTITADDGQTTNNTYSQNFNFTVLSEEAANALYRINCGGQAFTTSGGFIFEADQYYLNGRDFSIENAISGTTDDALYQSERTYNGTLSYEIPVPNGDYIVNLHFAEIYHTQNGARVMSGRIEGAVVLSNYDILASVGPFAMDMRSFEVNVTDGVLDIDLVASVDQPKISAIEVLRASVEDPNTPPAFALSGDIEVDEDFEGVYQVFATPEPIPEEEADQTVTYSLSPQSVDFADVNFDPATGEINISAVPNGYGSQSFIVTADDGQANNNLFQQTFVLTVNPVNDAPRFSIASEVMLSEDFIGTESILVERLDWEDNEPNDQVIYSISPEVADFVNLAIDPASGQLNLTAIPNANGSGIFTITADDGQTENNTYSQDITITVDPVNDAPVFSLSTSSKTLLENFEGTEQVNVVLAEVPTDEANEPIFFSLDPLTVDFAELTFDPVTGTLNIQSLPDQIGTQVFTFTASDGVETYTQTFVLTILSEPSVSYDIHINSGGDNYMTQGGIEFIADDFVTGGTPDSISSEIAGTENDMLYQYFRHGEAIQYDIPLYFGNYTIRVHLIEPEDSLETVNSINMNLEGIPVMTAFSVNDEIGSKAALIQEYNLTITDGFLDIDFSANSGKVVVAAVEAILTSAPVNSPPFFTLTGDLEVEANFEDEVIQSVTPLPVPPHEEDQVVIYSIEPESVDFANMSFDSLTGEVVFTSIENAFGSQDFIISANDGQETNHTVSERFTFTVLPPPNPPTELRINAGSLTDVTVGGHLFVRDQFSSTGLMWENEDHPEIAGTVFDEIYHTERTASSDLGAFSYEIPVENAQYFVVLHFAEIYWASNGGSSEGGIGTREFNVDIEGVPSLVGLDLIEEVGSMSAYTASFELMVEDGMLNLDFYASANRPKISAIEILPLGMSSTSLASADHNSMIDPNTDPTSRESGADKLIAAPNPAVDASTIIYEGELTGTFSLEIFDPWGKLVFKKRVEKIQRKGSWQIDVAHLPPGLYGVRLLQNGRSIGAKLWKSPY